MTYSSSYSKAPNLKEVLDEICDELKTGLNGLPPDISFFFVSHDHAEHFEELANWLHQKTKSRVLLGCTGETIAGGAEEMESGPAMSVWSAVLPETEIEPFHAEFSQTPDGIACSGLPSCSQNETKEANAIFILGEPFSSAPNSMIDRFADEFPGVPIIGGMASGAAGPNTNRLFLNAETISQGAVGAIVRGGPRIRSVVSQGCRPIGTHYVVTRAEQNVIRELGGAAPLDRLNDLMQTLSEHDVRLVQNGLHVGVVINEHQESFSRGDFLISNVVGVRENDGSIAIGNRVRVGQTVQFHVRDAETADEDLIHLLERDRNLYSRNPNAALLFSCNGRGTRLFPQPNHDAQTIQKKIGPIPLAGFFAQGEFGPIGEKNHVHGFTASIALFE